MGYEIIDFNSKGDLKSTEAWLASLTKPNRYDSLKKFGQMGVDALRAATPQKTGYTATQWYYEIVEEKSTWSIIWGNNNVVAGRPVAILLQVGHATRNGGYVQGRPYINQALKPIFDQIEAEARKVVNAK